MLLFVLLQSFVVGLFFTAPSSPPHRRLSARLPFCSGLGDFTLLVDAAAQKLRPYCGAVGPGGIPILVVRDVDLALYIFGVVGERLGLLLVR